MHTLAEIDNSIVTIVAICLGGGVAIISVVVTNIRQVLSTRAREHTRRELAAYVAEGTMTPEEAERLLKAGPNPGRQRCC